jgi:phosphoglycolate phosphatase
MTIIFDLDGTLIDAGMRMFTLFKSLVPGCTLDYPTYWEAKRKGISHFQILSEHFGYNQEQIEAFDEQWLASIENEELLALDKLYEGVPALLAGLHKNCKLYIATARQHAAMAIKQIEHFGVAHYFTEVFVTCQRQSKYQMLSQSLGEHLNAKDIMVGDTPDDVKTGKKLGILAYAVTNGFRNKDVLNAANPDKILISITHLKIF